MRVITMIALVQVGCLGPLVEDDPAYSVHILPPGSEVPALEEDEALLAQVRINDGLDDGKLMENDGVVPRIAGWANGVEISYWSFGTTTRVGAMAYVLVEDASHAYVPIEHPWLLDSIPGDPVYGPIRRIQHVVVTDAYAGEILTTVRALEDAIELGLVEEPVPAGTWVNAPVVAPGTRLDVGEGFAPAEPIEAYANGHRVPTFRFGGERGVQPLRSGQPPLGQAATLRERGSVQFEKAPVFQWGVPAEVPVESHNYTPLAAIVEVDLADGVVAAEQVHGDADLFTRSANGAISGVTSLVDSFVVTETVRNWPMQFTEGAP